MSAEQLARLTTLGIQRDIAQARADLVRQSAAELTSIRAIITGETLRSLRA